MTDSENYIIAVTENIPIGNVDGLTVGPGEYTITTGEKSLRFDDVSLIKFTHEGDGTQTNINFVNLDINIFVNITTGERSVNDTKNENSYSITSNCRYKAPVRFCDFENEFTITMTSKVTEIHNIYIIKINDNLLNIRLKQPKESQVNSSTTQKNLTMFKSIKNNNENCISVPIIEIAGQTLLDGSDLGDVKYAIIDKYQYYNDEVPDEDNRCGI